MWQLIKELLMVLARWFAKGEQPQTPEPQQAQDAIVAEAEHEIAEVPNKTDAELTDTAIGTGLVSPDSSGGASKPTSD